MNTRTKNSPPGQKNRNIPTSYRNNVEIFLKIILTKSRLVNRISRIFTNFMLAEHSFETIDSKLPRPRRKMYKYSGSCLTGLLYLLCSSSF